MGGIPLIYLKELLAGRDMADMAESSQLQYSLTDKWPSPM